MKIRKFEILSIIITGLLGISAAHAGDNLVPILACHFDNCIKGDHDRHCIAVFSQPRDRVATQGSNPPSSPNNVFLVKCDDDTIYDGGGFTKTEQFTNDPRFGMGIVTAINRRILPDYPSVFVDGDFEDFDHGFENRAARLYFDEHRFIQGECDHLIH